MYRILIADDEKDERDGIKYLIDEYKLPLTAAEAPNGKAALEYLKFHEVDILFTDIKMPFMNGLELAMQARMLKPDLKIVIFSAYGEFDYARQAIEINAVHYILKPIIIDEFIDVINKVVNQCADDRNRQEREKLLLDRYFKGLNYEKERLLLDVLGGTEASTELYSRMCEAGVDFTGKSIQMIMLDFKERFFDNNNESFRNSLNDILTGEYEYLNLNERQSIIFLKYAGEIPDRYEMTCLGKALRNSIKSTYGPDVCMLISRVIEKVGDIGGEFQYIDQILDYRFFFDSSVVIFAEDGTGKTCMENDTVGRIVRNICSSIDSGNINSARRELEMFFNLFNMGEAFSPVFVKYHCMEVVKKAQEHYSRNKPSNFSEMLERVFKCDTLQQLMELILSVIDVLKEDSSGSDEEYENKVIKNIKEIIQKNYMKDISLEWIADQVYLSPGYLCGLFKKEAGQSLVKYITAYRLEKAKELLLNTNMKIVDISEDVGYSNSSYFCMAYKKYHGLSPAKYREMGE